MKFSLCIILLLVSFASNSSGIHLDMPRLTRSQGRGNNKELGASVSNKDEHDRLFNSEKEHSENELTEIEREERDPEIFGNHDSQVNLKTSGKSSQVTGVSSYYHSVKATVNFAATQRATLFVNGQPLAYTSHYTQYKSVSVTVTRGDVIGFQASGPSGWHGIIADINIKNRHFVTGRHSFKSSTVEYARVERIETIWSLRSTQVCDWKTPIIERRPVNDVFSKAFPFNGGAKYVWAPDTGKDAGYVLLRYVIGGNSCSARTTPRPSSTPLPSPTPTVSLPDSGDRCDCIQINEKPFGGCFEYITGDGAWKKGNLQSCKRRDCFPKYECIDSKMNNNSSQCIRRYATEEIQKVKERLDGKLICTTVQLNPVKAFYTLYET